MTQRTNKLHSTNRLLVFASASLAGLFVAGVLVPRHAALAASNPTSTTTAAASRPDPGEAVLMDALGGS
jgi:hypothetical protein